jgi:hypothetical protein
VTRTEAITLLERVRSTSVCTYAGPTCDCKYGHSFRGEQTGCPELRDLVAMLGALTDRDWETLQGWAKVRQ